jgi:hypothetical protein
VFLLGLLNAQVPFLYLLWYYHSTMCGEYLFIGNDPLVSPRNNFTRF